jgi:predicted Zn-dependent protease with MMP-like domain
MSAVRLETIRDVLDQYPGVDAITFSFLNSRLLPVHVTLSRKEIEMNWSPDQLGELIKIRMRRLDAYPIP